MLHMTTGEKWFQAALIVFISLLCISMLYPFVHMMSISLSPPKEALRSGLHLFPREVTWEAYQRAVSVKGIWSGFSNTIFRTTVGTFLSLFMMALTAYPLSKKYLPNRLVFTWIIIFTMFFQGGLIPTYLLVKNIGLTDSLWVYVLAPPFLISTFSLLIMRNFFMQIPAELEESMKMDGAFDLRILFSLVLPLSKPIIATLGLWSAVNHWNAWFDGLIYIQDPSKIVLQIYLRRLIVDNMDQELQSLMDQGTTGDAVIPETVKAATLMLTVIPIILVYPFLQKYFVKGILVGSLKG